MRAPGQNGLHFSAWGSFVGQLLIRSMDRAQNLYQSMQMRGFRGSFYYARETAFGLADMLYIIIWAVVFLILRMFDLSELIGGLFL